MDYYPETEAATPPPAPRSAWAIRLWGFACVVLSVVILGALITYRAEEVSWAFLHPTATPAQACSNVLGPVGLYLAGLLYWLLGAGALYAFFLLLLVGFGMLVHPHAQRSGQAIALLCLIICACTALAVQTDVLLAWSAARGLNTPGGHLGYLDGSCVLVPLLGQESALCLMLGAHWFALLYFSRLTLRSFCLGVKDDAQRLSAHLAERRRRRDERRAAAREAWQQQVAAQPSATTATRPVSPAPPAPEESALPPRQRSGLLGRLIAKRSAPEAEAHAEPTGSMEMDSLFPDEDIPLPAPLNEQLEDARRRDAARIRMQTPAQQRHRRYTPAPTRNNRDNLLDLMQPVEEAIALSNAAGQEERPPIIEEERPRRRPSEPAARRAPVPAPTPAPRRTPKTPAAPAPAASDTRPQQSDYPLPPYDMLRFEPATAEMDEQSRAEMADTQQCIIETLDTFRIAVTAGDITRGPSVTRYEFYPPRGLRVNRIESLQKDLMLATRARSINILAPIPGKDTVGIELENSVKSPVYLRELLQSENFRNPKLAIPVALGKDVYGNAIIGDLAAMPHTLVAGTTGSGKSVCINSMILSMLYKFRPDELRLILVDPKVVEMQPYRTLPHLACPVVTNPARVIGALRWAVNEMERRYRMFSMVGVRTFKDFNARNPLDDPRPEPPPAHEELYTDDRMASSIVRDIESSNDGRDLPEEEEELQQGELDLDRPDDLPDKIPYIVIIIDELADLMQVVKEDLEAYIARLTQKARAAGIHLVAATQTPRSDVVTGLIKANIPSRIAFRVASPLDSRIILDTKGAENLLGKGDSLFVPPDGLSKMTRVQGAFVSDAEIQKIINFCASHAKQHFEQGVTAEMNNSDSDSRGAGSDNERFAPKAMSGEDAELYERCVNLVITERKASTSLLQRRFSIGYGKAAKIMDQMEENGIIGPSQGTSRPREVLVEEA